MTTAVLALTAAVLCLAGVVLLVGWWHLIPRYPESLTEDEIRQNVAPVVAAELMIMAARDTDPPLEDRTP